MGPLKSLIAVFLHNRAGKSSAPVREERRIIMKELVIIIRPEKLEKVKNILDENNCGGMTITSVMGCGTQKGVTEDEANTVNMIKGFKTNINLLPKIQVEVVVKDSKVEKIITEMRDKITTGHVGDGKVFIRDIVGAVRLRTGERDDKAL